MTNTMSLFSPGRASLQFAMIPMNFLSGDESADYVNTGTWSTKAIKEAKIQNKKHVVVASSEDKDFSLHLERSLSAKIAKYVYHQQHH